MQQLLPTYLDPSFISKRCTSEFWSSVLIAPYINLEGLTTLLGESFFLTTITPEDYTKICADFFNSGDNGIWLRAEISRIHIIAKTTNLIDSLIKEEKAKIIKGNIETLDDFLNTYHSLNMSVSEEPKFLQYIKELKSKHKDIDIVVNPENILLSLIKHVNHEFLENNVLFPPLMEILQKNKNQQQDPIPLSNEQEETKQNNNDVFLTLLAAIRDIKKCNPNKDFSTLERRAKDYLYRLDATTAETYSIQQSNSTNRSTDYKRFFENDVPKLKKHIPNFPELPNC